MGLHRMVIAAVLASTACTNPVAPTPRIPVPSVSTSADLQELLATCLQNAWTRSGPHATPESLARYHHFAALCLAKYARETS